MSDSIVKVFRVVVFMLLRAELLVSDRWAVIAKQLLEHDVRAARSEAFALVTEALSVYTLARSQRAAPDVLLGWVLIVAGEMGRDPLRATRLCGSFGALRGSLRVSGAHLQRELATHHRTLCEDSGCLCGTVDRDTWGPLLACYGCALEASKVERAPEPAPYESRELCTRHRGLLELALRCRRCNAARPRFADACANCGWHPVDDGVSE